VLNLHSFANKSLLDSAEIDGPVLDELEKGISDAAKGLFDKLRIGRKKKPALSCG
jgi:hypothetical protein